MNAVNHVTGTAAEEPSQANVHLCLDAAINKREVPCKDSDYPHSAQI